MCSPDPYKWRLLNRVSMRVQRCRGASLIELLAGLTIGLMVIAGAIATLEISRTISTSVSDLSQLQQQGSYALRIIGMQMRQAGSVEAVLDTDNGLYSFTGSALPTPAVLGIDGSGTKTDAVSISYQPALKSSPGRDCLGELANGLRADSRFFVQNTELRCQTSGKNQALIANVADFQVWYRVRSALMTTQRMTATQVEKAALWGSVKSIEVCLHLVGNDAGHLDSKSFTGCQNEVGPRNGRIHLVFRNVFDLRSQGA